MAKEAQANATQQQGHAASLACGQTKVQLQRKQSQEESAVMNRVVIPLSLLLVLPSIAAQEAKPNDTMQHCPMHNQQPTHQALMQSHGDKAMDFPQDKTTHHFRLMSDGGAIEVTADDPSDKADVAAIHSHLTHIAAMFSKGDFSTPVFIHDGVPPGVTTMKLMKAAIHYSCEETPSGGRVRIKSDDPIGVASVHDFLRFQITEHQTGDSLQVSEKSLS